MPLSWNEIRIRASNFVEEWKDKAPKAREEADAQDFQTDFLNIFGVSRRQVANFEHRVSIGGQEDLFGNTTGGRRGYIDLFWKGRFMIEMKTPERIWQKNTSRQKNMLSICLKTIFPKVYLSLIFITLIITTLKKTAK
jgi:hypothetical protein